MRYEQVIFNQTSSVIVRTCNANKKDSDEDEPIFNVGEDPLNTPLDQCIQCDDYHGISKRKHRRKKDSNNVGIVSDDEKRLLDNIKSQHKSQHDWESNFDIGPLGGGFKPKWQ